MRSLLSRDLETNGIDTLHTVNSANVRPGKPRQDEDARLDVATTIAPAAKKKMMAMTTQSKQF